MGTVSDLFLIVASSITHRLHTLFSVHLIYRKVITDISCSLSQYAKTKTMGFNHQVVLAEIGLFLSTLHL